MMQVSTWNDTNQHWIPQFLLKGFGIRGRASQVYEMDVQTGRVRICDVEDVASKYRLLTERDDELMKTIEVRSARIIGRIRKGNLKIRREDRQALDALVLAMMRNDPHSGFDEAKTRRDITSVLSHKIAESVGRQGGLVNLEGVKRVVGKHFSHDYLNIVLAEGDTMALKALALMGLSVHETIEGEFLIIGDSPVLVVRGIIGGARSLLNPGSEVILPIHSRLAMVYSWETPMNLIQIGDRLDQHQVRSLGRDYYYESNSRYIFGRSCESLKRARLSLLQWTSTARSTKVNDGWFVMKGELQRVSRQREETARAQQRELDSAARELVLRASQDLEGRQ